MTIQLTLSRVASSPTLKEWLVGIIPTEVGLLIPTPFLPFFTVPKAWHWGIGIKRPTSAGIKIPTSHSFRVNWDATLIRTKNI